MEDGDIIMPHMGRQQANERIARSETFPRHPPRTSSGQSFSSATVDSSGTSSSLRSTASSSNSHLIMINPDTTNGIQVLESISEISQATSSLNYGTSQGEDPSPSATNGISAATSLNSGTSQGEDPTPSSTNGIHPVLASSSAICQATSLNSGTSQGGHPSPCPTNGSERTLDEYCALCVPLHQAAMKGDWAAAKTFLKKYSECVRAPITKWEATALHIAAAAQHTTFVKKLLKLMDPADLKLKTNYGFTALHSAAQVGNVRIAKQLYEMNNDPLLIPDDSGDTPLIVAAFLRHANMVSYLFSLTDLKQLTNAKRIDLLRHTIYNDMYDIALRILKKVPNIESADTDCCWEALEMLARKPFAVGSDSDQLCFWKSVLNSWFKGIYNKALMKTLAHELVEELWKKVGIPDKQVASNLVHNNKTLIFEAAKVGNVEFLIILARSYPDLIWQQDENKMSIFHIAILYRHENVFNLIYEICAGKESLATYTNSETKDNMLHLAGQLAPSDRLNIVSGAALQMQRELLWFKEIEKIVPRSYVNKKNLRDQTPKDIFIEAHKDLQKAGEKWMKDTSNYCMLVATLIATVIFAAAFTVPGGTKQDTGIPIFLRSNWFMVFFISDAIALCSSSTSIVIFLSILTSRYTKEDFLKSLPSKLLFGLATLFISMAGMMVAFIATSFLVYTSTRAWASIVGITLASIPIISFVLVHCELWVDIFLATYKSRFLFQPNKHRLF